MKTLSLETCKAIEALGVKCETEKWWCAYQMGSKTKFYLCSNELLISTQSTNKKWYPAYSFSELLDIMSQIGRALKWQKATYIGVPLKMLDAYLTGGMEDVDKEMQKLLANE